MNLKSQISFPFLKKVSSQEILLFTKHLATMMKAGIPITEALETSKEQTKSAYFKKVLDECLEDIKEGKSLAVAFKKHNRVFDDFYVSLVDIAEEAGTLDESLEFLSKQLAKSYSLRKKIQGALMYPTIVVFATAAMGTFISLFVLPKLVDFFGSFEMDLPVSTKVLVVISNLMKNWGVLIFAIFGVLFILVIALTRNKKIKPTYDRLLIKLPIIGTLLAYGQLARFSRNLGTLIKSGVDAVRACEITANTLSNSAFRENTQALSKSLSKGKNLGDTMIETDYGIFPPLVSRMVSVGEKTGKLDETLLYLADFYEDEVDDISRNLSTILEPILLIVIGLVVGFVALAIISPIYQLTGSIRR